MALPAVSAKRDGPGGRPKNKSNVFYDIGVQKETARTFHTETLSPQTADANTYSFLPKPYCYR